MRELIEGIPVVNFIFMVFVLGIFYYRVIVLERLVERILEKLHNGISERIVRIEQIISDLPCGGRDGCSKDR